MMFFKLELLILSILLLYLSNKILPDQNTKSQFFVESRQLDNAIKPKLETRRKISWAIDYSNSTRRYPNINDGSMVVLTVGLISLCFCCCLYNICYMVRENNDLRRVEPEDGSDNTDSTTGD